MSKSHRATSAQRWKRWWISPVKREVSAFTSFSLFFPLHFIHVPSASVCSRKRQTKAALAGAGQIIILSSLCRNAAARYRVVQGRGAHQSGQDPPVPGSGRGQPANQRAPAGRHWHVSVLRPQSGGRDPDKHLPGRYK